MKSLKALVVAIGALSLMLAMSGCSGAATTTSLQTQTISFSPPSSQVTVGGAPVTLSATASGNLPVTYASDNAAVCTVSGSTLTAVASGTCVVTATQAGNATYAAAPVVTIVFTVTGEAQTINFTAPTTISAGSTETLIASATSGLAVTFTASPSTVCTATGTTLLGVSAGTCTVTASQSGNPIYAAAASVSHTVAISAGFTPPTPVSFSTGFTNNMTTLVGGAVLGYSGSDQDGYGCTNAANAPQCGSGSSASSSAAASYVYYYYQTFKPITGGEYVGLTVFAPGVTTLSASGNTSGLTLSGQTSLSFTLNTNPEWVTATGTPHVLVELTLGKLYSANGGTCNVQLQTVVPATGGAGATLYTVKLTSFVIAQNCGDTTVTQSTWQSQPIAKIDFQGDGGAAALTVNGVVSNSNLTTAASGSSPAVYPTTIALTGPITFQ